MKKCLFLVMIILISYSAFSQETERKFTIQTSPILLLFDLFQFAVFELDDPFTYVVDLEGQAKVTNRFNLSLTASFLVNNAERYDYSTREYTGETVFRVGLKPMFIWRPFGTGLRGFNLGLYPNIGLVSYRFGEEKNFLTEIGGGLHIGYKWITRTGFTTQIGSGIGRTFTLPETPDYSSSYTSTRNLLRFFGLEFFEFKMGYSF